MTWSLWLSWPWKTVAQPLSTRARRYPPSRSRRYTVRMCHRNGTPAGCRVCSIMSLLLPSRVLSTPLCVHHEPCAECARGVSVRDAAPAWYTTLVAVDAVSEHTLIQRRRGDTAPRATHVTHDPGPSPMELAFTRERGLYAACGLRWVAMLFIGPSPLGGKSWDTH